MFEDAINTAINLGADYVSYLHFATRKVVEVGSREITATCSAAGYDLIAAGISASGKSLLDYESGEFVCGTVAQLAG